LNRLKSILKILCIIIPLIIGFVFSQPTEDIIYLNDGKVVKGKIVGGGTTGDYYVQIKTKGQFQNYYMVDVREIRRNQNIGEPPSRVKKVIKKTEPIEISTPIEGKHIPEEESVSEEAPSESGETLKKFNRPSISQKTKVKKTSSGSKLLHSVGIGAGMYGPSMSYWNNEFIDDTFVNQSAGYSQSMTGFSSGPLFQGFITLKLGQKIRVSLNGGMWSGTAKAENLVVYGTTNDTVFAPEDGFPTGDPYEGLQYYLTPKTSTMTKDITVTMMPTTVIVAYEVFRGLYVGAGIGGNKITQKMKDNYYDPDTGAGTTDEISTDIGGTRTIVCVGYEMPLGPLAVAFQGNYVLGKYMQEMSDGYGVQKVEVGTDGIQLMVNIGLYFGQ